MSVSFDDGCAIVEGAVRSRAAVLDELAASPELTTALHRLRGFIQANERRLADLDRRTRSDGFHVLHDWDGKSDRVNETSIPIDVLAYVAERRAGEPFDPTVAAILLDYHLMHLLALLSTRIWDQGDADANLDRVDRLLAEVQGPAGSGQRFADDAATLLLIGTSHFELEERGYARLLDRVRTLNDAHRLRIALGHAPSLGSHLRFGFEATYARDTVIMRDDNVADYPWLCFSLVTLMRAYAAGPGERVAEALLNGLSADARAFVGAPPGVLMRCEQERSEFRALFDERRAELVDAFERYRPSDGAYSPLSFFFNFSHNVVKGAVVDALLRGRPWDVTLDDLLTAASDGDRGAAIETLAKTLMGYARANPDTIRGRLMPVIVYDPQAGRQAFSVTMKKIRT